MFNADNVFSEFYSAKILIDLMKRTGYPVVHEPGQRVFGPPPNWNGPPPERENEVFVGKLPKDCFEHEILEFVLKAGPIYKIRLMTNGNGTTRGFAFVTFQNTSDAEKAVSELNDTCLIRRPGIRIGVSASINNTRLIVYNMCEYLPENSFKKSVFALLGKLNITVRAIKTGTMGWLEFESHKEAALARKELRNLSRRCLGECVWVDWAPPSLPDYTVKTIDWKESNELLQRTDQGMVQSNCVNNSSTNDSVRAIKGIASSPQAVLLQQYLEQHAVTTQLNDNILKTHEALYNIDLNDCTVKYKNKNCLDSNFYCIRNAQVSTPVFPIPVEPVDAGACRNFSIVIPHNCSNEYSLHFETVDICTTVRRVKPKPEKDNESEAVNSELTSLLWSDYELFPSSDTGSIQNGYANAIKSNSNSRNCPNYLDRVRSLTARNDFTDVKPIYGRNAKYECVFQFPHDTYLETRDMLSAEKAKQFFAFKLPVNDKNTNDSV